MSKLSLIGYRGKDVAVNSKTKQHLSRTPRSNVFCFISTSIFFFFSKKNLFTTKGNPRLKKPLCHKNLHHVENHERVPEAYTHGRRPAGVVVVVG